ncbi:hypothetical protein AAHB33_04735 [Paenarthrobacter sp. S56]|uniref:hypothetical protein n=1 Tax=Paenarthrobacter sp. S56 TaxID=3138179 RepID=UPI00321A64B2
MTSPGYRRFFTIAAAVVAFVSLAAVAAVMAMAFSGAVPPVWVTSSALYGLPVAFVLAAIPVVEAVRERRRH